MFPLLLNPLPILITLSTAFGVLVHDTQLDSMAKTALTATMAFSTYSDAEYGLKLNDPHVHNESSSGTQSLREIQGSQPRSQTRNGDDKKYVIQKKSSVHSYGSEYIWPSI